MNQWLQFWEKSNRIYVNDRHREVHYREVAEDTLSVLPRESGARVLDYGCGDALEAPRVAGRVGRLYLFDAAQDVCRRLSERFGATANMEVLDEAGLRALPPGSLDLMIVNSVIQYLDRGELDEVLASAHRLLRRDGLLVLADVISPAAGAAADVTALLATAQRHGFLGAALSGMLASLFSDYGRLRRHVGLTTYAEPALRQILSDAGFAAERRPRNFGFNQQRMTFLARKSQAGRSG